MGHETSLQATQNNLRDFPLYQCRCWCTQGQASLSKVMFPKVPLNWMPTFFIGAGGGDNQLYFCNLLVITWPCLWNGNPTQQNILTVVIGPGTLRRVLPLEFVLPTTLVDSYFSTPFIQKLHSFNSPWYIMLWFHPFFL